MNLLHCQKTLLKTEIKIQDNGRQVLDFTCQKTGLHFRLSAVENKNHEDKAGLICTLCDKHCPYLREK